MKNPIRSDYEDEDFNLFHIDSSHIHSPMPDPNPHPFDPIPKLYMLAPNDNKLLLENKPVMSKSDIARKAAATRKANDPDAFRKMGSKGGKAKHKHKEELELQE